MDLRLLWGIALTLAVLAVLGAWFYYCGQADRKRRMRPFARRTLVYAAAGFAVGVAFLTSDLGTAPPQERMGILAFTLCCFLLVYAAASALTAANDQAPMLVNLTGRALLLSNPELAPFFTLPAPQETAADVLPPVRPHTYYVVTPELGRLGAQAGRTDVFVVDPATSTDFGAPKPLLIRRLLRVTPIGAVRVDSPCI
jgi:hypothetical protein